MLTYRKLGKFSLFKNGVQALTAISDGTAKSMCAASFLNKVQVSYFKIFKAFFQNLSTLLCNQDPQCNVRPNGMYFFIFSSFKCKERFGLRLWVKSHSSKKYLFISTLKIQINSQCLIKDCWNKYPLKNYVPGFPEKISV